MSERRQPAERSYARAVERSWSELCGRPVIFSPRDWALLDDWRQRGIPLQIVQEAIEAAAERRSSAGAARPPRSLAYIAPAVEEAWQVVVEGRLGDPAAAPRRPGAGPRGIGAWRECRDRQRADSALRRLLDELIAAFRAGASAQELETSLDDGIADAAPATTRQRAEAEIAAELMPYRNRMKPGVLESTRRRAVARRLRRQLGLPGLEPGEGSGNPVLPRTRPGK